MTFVLIKCSLTALFVAATTMVSRRGGPALGGWLAGLPLTSGPVSLFLALEQGPVFAANAAVSSIWGGVTVAAFSVPYALAATRFSCPGALAVAGLCYLLSVLLLSQVAWGLLATLVAALSLLYFSLFLVGPVHARKTDIIPGWWDIPLRMGIATTLVFTITLLASSLGPGLSGLLAPFPAFTCVLTVFAHCQYGEAAAHQVSRGVITGSFALVAFFLAVALLAERLPLFPTYLAAAFAAVGLNILNLKLLTPRARPPETL